jgi:GntR family transcriptional regulator, transcriptional repressor for pyruvate dehydrogenase complex
MLRQPGNNHKSIRDAARVRRGVAGSGSVRSVTEMRDALWLIRSVCSMLDKGQLRVGDRIPSAREFAHRLRIPAHSVRLGTRYLAMLGIAKTRPGGDAIITIGIERLTSTELILSQLEDPRRSDSRKTLFFIAENLAWLAAERRGGRYVALLAEELAELYTATEDPAEYLVHEVSFHRKIALAAGSQILSDLAANVAAVVSVAPRVKRLPAASLKESADRHMKIFRAIRQGKPAEARKAMQDHLYLAQLAIRKAQRDEQR